MITEEMKEQFNEQSMLMILHAGDAREKVNEALDQAMTGAYNTAAELIKEAKENINKSHKIQTVQVQKRSEGRSVLLFNVICPCAGYINDSTK